MPAAKKGEVGPLSADVPTAPAFGSPTAASASTNGTPAGSDGKTEETGAAFRLMLRLLPFASAVKLVTLAFGTAID